jgi:hypothetical protein
MTFGGRSRDIEPADQVRLPGPQRGVCAGREIQKEHGSRVIDAPSPAVSQVRGRRGYSAEVVRGRAGLPTFRLSG